MDPQLSALEAHYEAIDAWDAQQAAVDPTTPTRAQCGRCGWTGRISTHYLDNARRLAVRKCPSCHRKPTWRIT